MIRWPMRKSRYKSTEYNTNSPNGNREPKKSILRTKSDDSGSTRNTTGFYDNSTSMVDIRNEHNSSPLAHYPSNWDSVSSDFTSSRSYLSDRNTRGKRSVLFVDQLAINRQPSVDSNSSSIRNTYNIWTSPDKLINGNNSTAAAREPSALFSYPASYQSSPTCARREKNASHIELISRSPMMVRKESIESETSDTVSSRYTFRPSLPWFKRKSKKTDYHDSDGMEFNNSLTSRSPPTTTTDAISVSSINLRRDDNAQPGKATAADSTSKLPRHTSKTVHQSFHNTASKPPLPPSRDISSSPIILLDESRGQTTRVNENRPTHHLAQRIDNSTFQIYPVRYSPSASRFRMPTIANEKYDVNNPVTLSHGNQKSSAQQDNTKGHPNNGTNMSNTRVTPQHLQSPSPSVGNSSTIAMETERKCAQASPSNTPISPVVSRLIQNSRLTEMGRTSKLLTDDASRGDRRLRRRVTLTYAPEASSARQYSQPRHLPTASPPTGRIIAIRR